MEVSTALLLRTPLFRGIPQEALPALLEGLGARKRRCGRGEVVLRRGERADRLGLVLSGTLHIVKEDFWGSRTIVGLARSGEVFAEAYACLGGEPLEVAVLAAPDAEVLFLNSVQALSCARPGAAEFTGTATILGEIDPHPEDWPHGPPHHQDVCSICRPEPPRPEGRSLISRWTANSWRTIADATMSTTRQDESVPAFQTISTCFSRWSRLTEEESAMLTRVPDYYEAFHCLAGACPHTCCEKWEVVD